MAIQMRRGLKKDFDPQKMLPGEWAVATDAQTDNQIVWMCFSPGVVKRMGTYEDFEAQIHDISGDIINQFIQQLTAAQKQLQSDTETYIQGKVDDEWIPELQALVDKAAKSASAAQTSQTEAKKSETAASTSALAAAKSESNAATSQKNASLSESSAATSSQNAAKSASEALTRAGEAENWRKLAESYAHGQTAVRDGEATDNALYYYEQAKRISSAPYITNEDTGKQYIYSLYARDGIPHMALVEKTE